MRDIAKTSIILFLICLIVAVSLGFTYSLTKDKIAERAKIDAENARKEVLSGANSFKAVEIPDMNKSMIKEAYMGVNNDSVVGYVFRVTNKGYGGDVSITVGIDRQGRITGIRVGDNKETPGLGAKAADKPFISQLVGITPQEALRVVKGKKTKPEEIQAISGATITSRAVTEAVQAAIDMSGELIRKEGDQK